ncbi:uncharacterized protein tinf2 [Xyrichtys novacula]|uniref:Uncharacterized protein tinf2 n=1 Tax=Xyrichtys novacula TaxID=13765 RepID=A0AAV1HLU0_XYRNO|nr:uncharacterized protein tinf2 [Xyrichtys novacula]
MATRKPKDNGGSIPFAALQLLAPPVRLVSAALWKVMEQRDVMQYGVVEEFVTSACETVPGLLTVRHQSKLALGLRGRLILELCSSNPDEKVIKANLERICAPAALSSSSSHVMKRDVKILRTVESFHSLVHILLTDAAEREHFFKEEFPVDYGPEFDRELGKLLWEFLMRLDQLLPVPSLAQTASWLSDAPPVLEQCAQAATQPQLLKILLQHQTCLGHLESAASLPPNMGDSILDSLSLLPSGKVPSKQSTGAKLTPVDRSAKVQTQDKTPFVTPVFGLLSSEDVPVMISAKKRTEKTEKAEEEKDTLRRSCEMKRKRSDVRQSESEEEEEVSGKTRSGKKRVSATLTNAAETLKRGRSKGETKESKEDGAITQDVDAKMLKDPPSCPTSLSFCMSRQPRVVIERLPVASLSTHTASRGGKPAPVRASPLKNTDSQPQTPESDCAEQDNKENHPARKTSSSSPQRRTTSEMVAPSGDGEDYVADSEDEATKNFKSRLFMKCYYKTKHGTYVPTLREFRKRPLSSAHGKQRWRNEFSAKP